MKCKETKQNFRHALLEWRITPRADGVSPAEAMFGRQLRGKLPVIPSSKKMPENFMRNRAQQTDRRHNERAREHPSRPLVVGETVRVQDVRTGRWDTRARVESCRRSGKSYKLIDTEGYTIIRPRHLLKSISSVTNNNSSTSLYFKR